MPTNFAPLCETFLHQIEHGTKPKRWMSRSPEQLLQLLQRHLKQINKVNQIQTLLITNGYLLPNSNHSNTKWITTLLYNTLIRAHLNHTDPHNAIQLFAHMLSHQAPPNSHTFPSLIKAASSSPSLGRPLHSQVTKRGLSLDPFILTSFVSFYAQFGSLPEARMVFEEIPKPCIVSMNSMLDAFGRNGDMGSAVLLFQSMPDKDVVSWTSIINGFGRNRCFEEAILFFERMVMHESGTSRIVMPNEATLVSVLSSVANSDGAGSLFQGKQIHSYIIKNNVELTAFLGTALISMYGKTGCLESAIKVFNITTMKQVCTWNAMICSLSSNGREKEALTMFENMKARWVKPNEVTFVAILTSCARSKLVELGLRIFHSMRDFQVVPRMEHYGCVVDLLGRAGLLDEATKFVQEMPFEPDSTVLGALLGACKLHGNVKLAGDVGRKLIELQPQHCGRYVVLSNIYADAGKWSHASELRKAMVHGGISKNPAYSWIDST